ncbi:MAG: hypothetical protein M0Q92_03100 [Methanoregula sp.]|jgi:hypothetical protein|nr:hypothetical protein [Methanoregula sp.]
MQQITSSKKYQDGTEVFWTCAGMDVNNFLLYENLVDLKIQVLDLLNNPRLCRVHEVANQI